MMNHDNLSALKAFAPQYYEQSPTTISLADTSLMTPSTPAASVRSSSVGPQSQPQSAKKQVKKRKSWGQELPVPKTNLPPRKRAKTDDEKEQRRIERVLRNRAAAQSSRERKRQEVERLEGEKHNIEYHNHCLKQRLLAVEHEKFLLMQEVIKLRTTLGHPNPNASIAMPEQPPMPAYLKPTIKQEMPESAFAIHTPQSARSPAPSRASICPSTLASRSPSPSPSEEMYGEALTLDLTQHPAAVLCDLQCRSTEAAAAPALPPAPRTTDAPTAGAAPSRTAPSPTPVLATRLRLLLTAHSAACSQVLAPLSRISASLRTGSPLPAMSCTAVTPLLLRLMLWSTSTPSSASLTRTASPSTATTSTTAPTSTSMPAPWEPRPRTFRPSLLRCLLSSSPALARPLRDATARALLTETSYALRGMSESRCSLEVTGDGEGVGAGRAGSEPSSEVEQLKQMATVLDEHLREQQRTARAASGVMMAQHITAQ